MTAHTPPAARRRNTHLIATCAQLIAEIGHAAAEVYNTVAGAGGEPVVVSGREIYMLGITAATRLDRATQMDRDQWAAISRSEEADSQRAARERAVLAEVEQLLDMEPDTAAEPVARPAVPEMTAQQGAALAPAGAIDALLGEEVTPGRVRTVAAEFEVPVAELLAGAIVQHTASACIALQEAAGRAPTDPSAGAELALAATPHLVDAVRIASLDV
ncbi:hypothetical protein [Streptomyces sp. NBRC 109706]|uniref:hypothetical protein n=1 Tax=Streptomyces sp. NBRC 109706 TaxID=1550035 RepID=UPI0007844AD9|nr:hypothetical protein [Streptomyces sp. NBRC 109706]